jgi:hypothetical protein
MRDVSSVTEAFVDSDGVRPCTVERHIANIYAKIGARGTTNAAG